MDKRLESNPPKKRLKQTSIEDFISITPKSGKNCVKMNVNDNQMDSQLASTSHSAMDCTESMQSINESTNGSNDHSLEVIDLSQMSDLSEIPETPEMVVSSEDQSDGEDETQLMYGLNTMPECLPPMFPLRPNSSRLVLFAVDGNEVMETTLNPFPNTYTDRWDSRHVKMPNSSNHAIIDVNTTSGNEVKTRVPKWELIQEILLSGIKSSELLEEAIKTYNPFIGRKRFDVLHTLFNHESSPEERVQFFDEIMPQMIGLALQLPLIVTQSVPLLRQRQNATLFLSQKQIACLLANAFFCTFPKRSHTNEEYKNYPIINFLSLFTSYGNKIDLKTKIEKLKCIVNYFRRVIKDMPKGVISFERRYLTANELPVWHNSEKTLRKLIVLKNGFIEREGNGLLQVDFANKYIGGGVIGSGCVQEEIRFVISPELIISRLFTERLLDNEVLVMNGCEQFNTYSGYANSFEWRDDYIDCTPYDQWGRRLTRIVAIDALCFSDNESHIQFETKYFERELNKAFCGFVEQNSHPKHNCAIASGNWGCGAFNGCPTFKAIIQLMAASQADRDLVLFTFNDNDLKERLKKCYTFLTDNRFLVKDLYKSLKLFQQKRKTLNICSNLDILDFIQRSKDSIFETQFV